ncbi:MAG TPA: hypothetical protein VFE62_27215, partial [Gemmataceae bacterium]|nr:hypothetical protein [Gemmataceae bacterium]
MNRIRDIVVVNHRLDPISTELHVHIKLDAITPTTALKGRLIGPRSMHATTIEIAYPLHEIERSDHIVLRAVIPESSWWEPRSPFLYEGPLELWQDDVLCDRATIRHGIRALQLTSKGLRLNGKPLVVRGKLVHGSLSEQDAIALRDAGFSACWLIGASNIDPWNSADRVGLFLLGSCFDVTEFFALHSELTSHASHFGWIFNRNDLSQAPLLQPGFGMLYGINTSARSIPENSDFMVCTQDELAWLEEVDMPRIVVAKKLADPLLQRAKV